jgi:hypothetical protein
MRARLFAEGLPMVCLLVMGVKHRAGAAEV